MAQELHELTAKSEARARGKLLLVRLPVLFPMDPVVVLWGLAVSYERGTPLWIPAQTKARVAPKWAGAGRGKESALGGGAGVPRSQDIATPP